MEIMRQIHSHQWWVMSHDQNICEKKIVFVIFVKYNYQLIRGDGQLSTEKLVYLNKNLFEF